RKIFRSSLIASGVETNHAVNEHTVDWDWPLQNNSSARMVGPLSRKVWWEKARVLLSNYPDLFKGL
ncbi:MAG TPA: hypothetical protein VK880_00710, partial [Anaerolineales bacterium]|nr:hypothetical protein [Anaerolineales bacterium]